MILKDALIEKARMLGLADIRIASAELFQTERALLYSRLQEGYLTPASAGDIMRRTDPQMSLPGAQSILVAAAVYRMADGLTQDKRLARYARLRDYHQILRSALGALAEEIVMHDPAAQCRIIVDTGPLVERAAACRAGLGFIGKNCSLIAPEQGSFVVLGALLTTVSLHPDSPLQRDCGDCRLCLDACPTGALAAPYTLRETICLSYLTQKKGWIPKEYRKYIKNTLWGCDVCQEVCPYNHGERNADVALWDTHTDKVMLPGLYEILRWDNTLYFAAAKDSTMSWRGRTVLQRNALLILANRHDPADVAAIALYLQDPRPVIRGHAAWALGEIHSTEARKYLAAARIGEKDEDVQGEIMDALHSMG